MGEAGYDHLNKLGNNEHFFFNDDAEHVDIKDIKIEEADIYDGTNYLNNENFPKIKLENEELSTNENCDELCNSIYKENDFPNQVLSDEQWNGKGNQVSTNNANQLPVDMKMMIEIGETNFFDGTTYLKYENCGIKTEPEHSTLDNCHEYQSEREIDENKDSICDDGDFSNQGTLDGEQLNQNEISDKLDESDHKLNIKEAILKCVPCNLIQCQFCDSTTTTSGGMKKHIEVVHFGLRNHKCEYCDYATERLSVLKYHINSVHHKIRNHKCHYCDYAGSQLGVLKRHINSVHLKIKNSKCEHCDYTTSNRSNLKNHIDVVHHKIKNRKCEHCDYTASYASVLKKHKNNVHHKLKKVKCEYCDYTATQTSNLKYHINTVHLKIKNHKCEHCDYAASHLRDLKTHINAVHLKIKNYKCEYCDYAASQLGVLKSHINVVHLKIKKHKCQYCDYTASKFSHVERHVSTVHHKI